MATAAPMSGMISLAALILWFGAAPVPVEATGLSATVSRRGTTVAIGENNGGSVIAFAHRVLDLYESKAIVKIEGDCSSACALITALPKERICLGPGARLRVHQASYPDGRKDARLTRLMWNVYPSWMQREIGDPSQLDGALVDINRPTLLRAYDPCLE